uniref:Uncharacterized protein n=1 Tax=Noctiluca scintillans TaxID=2966 RepID=A0A7S0ZR22_NOCSC|mmetsp:Transcript_15351/g.42044  ORF Transcript_15351/g.42044 Transcript_15351/m.42044 type:complete len:821 (+) Transcript_15351:36-2498(+)
MFASPRCLPQTESSVPAPARIGSAMVPAKMPVPGSARGAGRGQVAGTHVASVGPKKEDAAIDIMEGARQESWLAPEVRRSRRANLGLDVPRTAVFIQQCEFVSLGCYCAASKGLQALGLKRYSYPFDWIRSPAEGIIQLLDTQFADFSTYTESRDEGCKGHYMGPSKWGGSFWHHDISQAKVRDDFLRRIERFLGSKEIPPCIPRVFVRAVNCTAELETILDLRSALQRALPQAKVFLVVLVDNQMQSGSFRLAGCGDILFFRIHETVLNDNWTMEKQSDAYAEAIAAASRVWSGAELGQFQDVVSLSQLRGMMTPMDSGDPGCRLFYPYRVDPLAVSMSASQESSAKVTVSATRVATARVASASVPSSDVMPASPPPSVLRGLASVQVPGSSGATSVSAPKFAAPLAAPGCSGSASVPHDVSNSRATAMPWARPCQDLQARTSTPMRVSHSPTSPRNESLSATLRTAIRKELRSMSPSAPSATFKTPRGDREVRSASVVASKAMTNTRRKDSLASATVPLVSAPSAAAEKRTTSPASVQKPCMTPRTVRQCSPPGANTFHGAFDLSLGSRSSRMTQTPRERRTEPVRRSSTPRSPGDLCGMEVMIRCPGTEGPKSVMSSCKNSQDAPCLFNLGSAHTASYTVRVRGSSAREGSLKRDNACVVDPLSPRLSLASPGVPQNLVSESKFPTTLTASFVRAPSTEPEQRSISGRSQTPSASCARRQSVGQPFPAHQQVVQQHTRAQYPHFVLEPPPFPSLASSLVRQKSVDNVVSTTPAQGLGSGSTVQSNLPAKATAQIRDSSMLRDCRSLKSLRGGSTQWR